MNVSEASLATIWTSYNPNDARAFVFNEFQEHVELAQRILPGFIGATVYRNPSGFFTIRTREGSASRRAKLVVAAWMESEAARDAIDWKTPGSPGQQMRAHADSLHADVREIGEPGPQGRWTFGPGSVWVGDFPAGALPIHLGVQIPQHPRMSALA